MDKAIKIGGGDLITASFAEKETKADPDADYVDDEEDYGYMDEPDGEDLNDSDDNEPV